MLERTISAGYARALMELAVKRGASRKSLAARSGIDLGELQDQDNRISFPKYVALMRAAQELCNDPALALHFGEAFDVDALSIVGLIGQSCETMADAFVQLNRFSRLIADVDAAAGDHLVLEREGGKLWLVDTRKIPGDFPELIESSFVRMVCRSRRVSGAQRFIKAVHFMHVAPAHRAEYDRIFQLPVVFQSDRNALLMTDDSWLTLKNPLPSRYVFGILSERAQALLASLENSKSTRGRVESVLMPILHTGDAGMHMIANKLRISRQTLFRRLKAEGVNFSTVLDELRHRMALHYLGGKKVSVNETAYLVGFSDPAAFSRAFKRWTGRSPGTVHSRRAGPVSRHR